MKLNIVMRPFLLQLVIFVVAISNIGFGQNVQVDSVVSKEGTKTYLYKGYSLSGERTGTWTGTDTKTDSIKYYLVYRNGYLLKRYYLNPEDGPQLQFEVNKSLDTLTEYSYDNTGNLMQVFVWKIRNDSLLKKNCLTFCAKEEGAVVEIKRLDYVYNYFGVVGMLQINESDYGGKKFKYYYYNGQYVCSFGEDGKLIKGDKKRYESIMKNKK